MHVKVLACSYNDLDEVIDALSPMAFDYGDKTADISYDIAQQLVREKHIGAFITERGIVEPDDFPDEDAFYEFVWKVLKKRDDNECNYALYDIHE